MLSMSKIILAAVAVTAVQACVDQTYGQGACDGEPVTENGNGSKVTPDIVNRLEDCFVAKYGVGPYVIDGVDIPDFGGLGNAWGVRLVDENNITYMMTLSNNCGCKNTMDGNIVNTLVDAAGAGESTVMKITCGIENCGGAELPSGMAMSATYCVIPEYDCGGQGYQRFEIC